LNQLKVESVETGGDFVKLRLDDGSAFLVGTAYLSPEHTPPDMLCIPDNGRDLLCAGARIEPEFLPVLEYAAECRKAEKAALALIARAEQCRWALARKLEKKHYPPAVVQAVLSRLTNLELVNDRRFAELWLKSRIRMGDKGPRTLLLLLRARGIDRKTAEAALSASLTPEAEDALLRRCLARNTQGRNRNPRNNAGEPANSADHKRTIRLFLKSQGFSAAAIDQYFEE
jgi:regulatory protein